MRISIAFCLTFLAACNAQRYQPLHIAVYPSEKRCAVQDTPLPCEQLPIFLREQLKVQSDRDITVSYAGTESAPKDDTSLEQIATLLQTNGFKNARAIRFEMK